MANGSMSISISALLRLTTIHIGSSVDLDLRRCPVGTGHTKGIDGQGWLMPNRQYGQQQEQPADFALLERSVQHDPDPEGQRRWV